MLRCWLVLWQPPRPCGPPRGSDRAVNAEQRPLGGAKRGGVVAHVAVAPDRHPELAASRVELETQAHALAVRVVAEAAVAAAAKEAAARGRTAVVLREAAGERRGDGAVAAARPPAAPRPEPRLAVARLAVVSVVLRCDWGGGDVATIVSQGVWGRGLLIVEAA